MIVAVCGLLMAGFPVAPTLAGTALLFALGGAAFGVFDLSFLIGFPQSVFATMTSTTLVAVPLFVFMGVMLERSAVAEQLLAAMARLFGRRPGGLAVSVSVVGALLAASTGIVGASVVTMGLLSLPVMLRQGYDPAFATGSIAASGTLGQIIPPSIVLVFLGDQLSAAYQTAQFERGVFAPETVSVDDLFAGALLPGVLLVGLFIVYQVGFSLLRPGRAPAMTEPACPDDSDDDGDAPGVVRALIAPVGLIVAVLGSILGGLATPTEAAAVGAVGATMLAAARLDPSRVWPVLFAVACGLGLVLLKTLFDLRVQRAVIPAGDAVAIGAAIVLSLGLAWGVWRAFRLTWRARLADGVPVLGAVARSTLTITSMIFLIVICARMFSLVFRGYGGAAFIEAQLGGLPGGATTALLVVMATVFLLGFFLDFLEILFIVVPVVAPILLQMEMPGGGTMSPVWLGVLLALNLQTSFLTPPFGFALFYLRGVAPEEVRTADIYRGIVPFVLLQIAALALVWNWPGLATWLPATLTP